MTIPTLPTCASAYVAAADAGDSDVEQKPPVSLRPVIVCTEHRGVFYGLVGDTTGWQLPGAVLRLHQARMAIYWGTERGVFQLAATGPTRASKISAAADIEVNKITAVVEVSEAAAKAWAEVK